MTKVSVSGVLFYARLSAAIGGLAAVESTIPFGVIGGISMETLGISAARYYRHAQYLTALQTNARIVE